MQPTSKRIHTENSNLPSSIKNNFIPQLPDDTILVIFSECLREVITRGEITSKNYQTLLKIGNPIYWQSRTKNGSMYTSEHVNKIVSLISKTPSFDTVALKFVEKPFESWEIITKFPHLTSLTFHESPEILQGGISPENTPILQKISQQISLCTHLKHLEVFPGELLDSSVLNNLTDLESLGVVKYRDSSEKILEKIMNYTKLITLKIGVLQTFSEFVQLGTLRRLENLEISGKDFDFKECGPLADLEELKGLTRLKQLALCFTESSGRSPQGTTLLSKLLNHLLDLLAWISLLLKFQIHSTSKKFQLLPITWKKFIYTL